MDLRTNLVLLWNAKTGKFEDKTIQVRNVVYEHNRAHVEFLNGKSYLYIGKNVKIFRSPKLISRNNHILLVEGFPLEDGEILDFGPYIRVILRNGFSNVYPREQIEIKKSFLEDHKGKSVFDFLKALAPYVSPESGEKYAGRNFLLDQYTSITQIDPDCVLAAYLSSGPIKENKDIPAVAYPFGLNLSQREAANKAFENSISIIEGPPGTGKTQTILNIIANAIVHEKTVAVLSANNSAIMNVQEKLRAAGYGFLSALLGNSENQSQFFETNQVQEIDFKVLEHDPAAVDDAYRSLHKISRQLDRLFVAKNEIAKLRDEVSRLQAEQSHFESAFYGKDLPLSRFTFHPAWANSKLLAFIHYFEKISIEDRCDSKVAKAWLFIRYGIYRFGFLRDNANDVVTTLYRLYYKNSIKQRQEQIEAKEKDLVSMNCDVLATEHRAYSHIVFQDSLSRMRKNRVRQTYSKGTFKRNFKDFIRDYPVILSTTYSIRKCIPPNYLFDYLIIDESSQTDIVTGALAMSCCKNMVIVGDGEQLGQIVNCDQKNASDFLLSQQDLHEAYNFNNESILSSVAKLYGYKIKRTLLREHYRCHPSIIRFCNEKFYDNQLVVMTNNTNENPLYLFKTAPGNHAREVNTSREKGHYNLRQIEIIRDEILGDEKYGDGREVGIISPYRLHANETQKIVGEKYPGIEADTVHKFQGREKHTIIYSTVLD